MKTAQFTPGPWVVDEDYEDEEQQAIGIVKEGRGYIAGIHILASCNNGEGFTAEDRANAALIAAAPAMYEALKDLIGDLGDLHGGSIAELQCHWCGRDYEDEKAGGLCTSDDCPGYIARQAIAQAEGRHPRKEETCK